MNEACKIGDTCKLEICCFDLESVQRSALAGVPQVEICIDYLQGGLWPGLNFLKMARSIYSGCLSVMIRPRQGDFVYSDEELDAMRKQIDLAQIAGVNGITLGCLSEDLQLPEKLISTLTSEVSSHLVLTFHRAFDQLKAPEQAIKSLADLGFSRILTSGGGIRAIKGEHLLSQYQEIAGPGLDIVAAGSVRPSDLPIFQKAGLRTIHSAASNQADGKADAKIIEALMSWCDPDKSAQLVMNP